jgi:hypothetical protein
MIYLVVIPLLFLYIKITAIIHSNHFLAEFIPTQKNIKPRTANSDHPDKPS